MSIDYSKMKIKPSDEFTGSNNQIKSKLQNTFNFRLGSELRFNKFSREEVITKLKVHIMK